MLDFASPLLTPSRGWEIALLTPSQGWEIAVDLWALPGLDEVGNCFWIWSRGSCYSDSIKPSVGPQSDRGSHTPASEEITDKE